MKVYRVFDAALASDLSLPELMEVEASEADIRVSHAVADRSPEDPADWLHEWTSAGGEVTLACARTRNGYLVRFPGFVDFTVSESGRAIHASVRPGVAPETVRHQLLDQIVPRVLGQGQRLVVHASAVDLGDGRGIAFLGDTGTGKSTLAAYLSREGAQLLTDDSLLLESASGCIAGIPGYAGLRLRQDSLNELFPNAVETHPVADYSGKRRVTFAEARRAPAVKLGALFVLGDHNVVNDRGGACVEPVTGVEALTALIRHAFVLDPRHRANQGALLAQAGAIARTYPTVMRLRYERQYACLAEVRQLIERHLEERLQSG